MLKGSSPVKLAQLDMSPIVRASKMLAASKASLDSTLLDSINTFATKQKELKLKKEREAQIDEVLPGLLKQVFPNLDEGSENYAAYSKFVKKEYGDDLLKGIKTMKEIIPTATPTLQQIEGPGGSSVYTFDGSVVDPNKVMTTGDGGQSLGFEGEYPMTYMVQYNDGGTPDDLSDDRDAYRVQASTVNEVSPGLKDPVTDQTINKGDQVYRDIEGNLRKVDLQNMIPFSDVSVNKYTDRMFELKGAFDEEAKKAESFRNYIDARGKMSDSGAQRFFDDLSFKYKTLFGDKQITQAEYAQAESRALFRQQLGGLRLDILGPGVLTEFDRQVIEQAIGGFGPLSNNLLATNIINNYLEKSLVKGKSLGNQYNSLYTQAPREIKMFAPQIDTSVFNEAPSQSTQQPMQSNAISSIDFGKVFENADATEKYLKEQGQTEGVFIYNGEYYKID